MSTWFRSWLAIPIFLIGALAGGLVVGLLLDPAPAEQASKPDGDDPPDLTNPEGPTAAPKSDPGSPAAAPTTASEAARRRHTFDCRGFVAFDPFPDAAAHDLKTIAQVEATKRALAGETIRIRARVMSAWPRIKGLNWLHLCDEVGGQALIVSTEGWVHAGSIATVAGRLSLDRDVGGGITFPLLLESAQVLNEERPDSPGSPDPSETPIDL